jgi:uncharacterized protein (TIGR02301 family)
MIRRPLLILTLLTPLLTALGSQPVLAQEGDDPDAAATSLNLPPPPYEDRLLRLAEILGSIQYLRNLCNSESETGWLESMQALLDSETADEPDGATADRRLQSWFSRICIGLHHLHLMPRWLPRQRYRREGATLVSEIVARYGN